MVNILSHRTKTVIERRMFKFNCSCGCSFESDEYNVVQEKCINGKIWFEHICPECGYKINLEVSRDVRDEYVITKVVEVTPNGKPTDSPKTTDNPADDNFDTRFDKNVPYVCKDNHPLYVVYKLSCASSEIQKQCKFCGNVIYIGTDTEEELKTLPYHWFAQSDAEDRCGMINGVIKVVRDANLNGTKTAVVAYVDPRSNETMASLTVNIA